MASIRTQWNDAAWFNWGYTVTRVSGNSFTVATASWNTVTLPAAFEVNGRIKLLDTSTLYGTITTVSASAASTLVTFTPDSGSLTASFSSVFNSIISPTNTAIPGLTIPTDVITQKTQQIYSVDSGATNSAQLALAPTLTSYVSGQMLNFKAAATNTGAMTLQVEALGSKTIKKQGGASDLAAGDIIAGQDVQIVYDGTNWQMMSPVANSSSGSSGRLLNIQTFTSSGTYTKTAGTNSIEVQCQGAGGGGGGVNWTVGQGAGGGGGGGGYGIYYGAVTSPVAVTVGVGGIGGIGSTSTPATAGGTSSFGAIISCTGGGLGDGMPSTSGSSGAGGGRGGISSGGTVNGGGGGAADVRVVDGIWTLTSMGANSLYGGGGAAGFSSNGSNAIGYGAGGGGAAADNASRDGGAGANGIVIVFEYS